MATDFFLTIITDVWWFTDYVYIITKYSELYNEQIQSALNARPKEERTNQILRKKENKTSSGSFPIIQDFLE